MKLLVVLALCFGAIAPAFAEDAPAPAAAPAAPPAATPTTPRADDDHAQMKAVVEQCRDAVMAKGLDGAARHQAMAACILAARPELTARIHCLIDPKIRAMDKDARKIAIMECIAKGH
ncbi:MAG: hypothetical protein ACLP8A_17620 [Methylovirgula sp.]